MDSLAEMLSAIRSVHEEIRDALLAEMECSSIAELASVAEDGEGDTIYAIDRVSEDLLIALFDRKIASQTPIILIAEGLPGGRITLPYGSSEQDARWRVLADPIDGTRCLMYQKRSGWILTGVAPNLGEATCLQDIVVAVQTEIPLIKQHLSDCLWAIRGQGASAERWNRITRERLPTSLRPSAAKGIGDGFCSVTRFFSGGRDILALLDDEVAHELTKTDRRAGKAYCFEDQYLSTGGQLYELMAGHDRFLADVRPLLEPALASRGLPVSLCCHPYDLCTELIAREFGVLITDAQGGSLNAPLDLETDVAWAGFANTAIRDLVEPVFIETMRRIGLIDGNQPQIAPKCEEIRSKRQGPPIGSASLSS